MAKYKNTSARKVSVNFLDKGEVKTIDYLPAEDPKGVETPAAAEKSDFHKALVKDGTLVKVTAEKK